MQFARPFRAWRAQIERRPCFQIGGTAGEAYVKSAEWLKFIEGGGSVSISGTSTTFYTPPEPPKPATPGK